jgi:peptide/nickel transport system substrate-binding protein
MKRCLSLALLIVGLASAALAQSGGELRFCLRSGPKTLNPHQVADDSSETVRYLTAGVLLRVNRSNQQLEPELATSWKVLEGGKRIEFKLRDNVLFSDGTPFTPPDVVHTFTALMDPKLKSPTGDSFRSDSGPVKAEVTGPNQVTITFPAVVAGVERLFDQVAIVSARSPKKEMAVLGPFFVAEHQPGAYLLLKRNPNYWKKDAKGKPLPYLDAIRLDIQQNRDLEAMRLRRGEIHFISNLDAESFERLRSDGKVSARDLGPSLEGEQLWFNQSPSALMPPFMKAWFTSVAFRRAVSQAINRADIARVVYLGHASPAIGPISPANKFWFNSKLKPYAFDPQGALALLEKEGFRKSGDQLRDRHGNPVEFSLITNSGNKSRERTAALIQQDLKQIGIRLNVVTLDFPSLIERITKTFDYEACLLGLVNVDLDPNAQMNVWLSSSSNHQWNPNQKTPATAWEAEIDKLMRLQASSADPKKRKEAFDRVQEIVMEQLPFLYLVNKNALVAVSPAVANAAPTILRPQVHWNIERLVLAGSRPAATQAGGQ